MDWLEIVAGLVNGALVLLVVQWLKNYGMSWMKTNVPWLLPILALGAAQGLGLLASFISGFLGYPIDFSPIVAVLVGSMSVVAYDVKHAYSRKAK